MYEYVCDSMCVVVIVIVIVIVSCKCKQSVVVELGHLGCGCNLSISVRALFLQAQGVTQRMVDARESKPSREFLDQVFRSSIS